MRSVGKRRAAGMVSNGMDGSDRDAGVGGELAEVSTIPGGRRLSSGSPEVFKNNITPRFMGKKKGSPVGEPLGAVGQLGQWAFFATGMRIP